MAQTANMNLAQWSSGGDFFSYSQLATNFGLIDTHNHTAGKGTQIPAGGIAPQAVGTEELVDEAVTVGKLEPTAVAAALPAGSITNTHLAGSIADSKLASSQLGTWVTLVELGTIISAAYVTSTAVHAIGQDTGPSPLATGQAAHPFNLSVTDNAVTGKNTNLRLKASYVSNAVALGTTVTVGISLINSGASSSAGVINYNSLAAAGSDVVVAPAATSASSVTGTSYTIPTPGLYLMRFALAATPAANHGGHLSVKLQRSYS